MNLVKPVSSKLNVLRVKSVPPLDVGLMGMEALETVIGYWEDALAAYNPTGNLPSQISRIISHPTRLKEYRIVLTMLWNRNDFFGSGSYFSVGFGAYMNFFLIFLT